MIRTIEQRTFEALVKDFGNTFNQPGFSLEEQTRAAKAGDNEAADMVAAAIVRIAFITPTVAVALMDDVTRGWFDLAPEALATPQQQRANLAELSEPGALGDAFWNDFWGFVCDPNPSTGGDEITARVASLAANRAAGFNEHAERAVKTHPGAIDAAHRDMPPRLTLETLGRQPEGSLGHDFYRLIVDNNFNLEVLDREAIGLANLSPALSYLNTRILQMHDVWHLVGGYRTTVLQEIGISAFQLAQFGHDYSAMLIATAAAASRFKAPEGFNLIMQLIAEGWLHGRQMPAFMAIDWESEWHLPITEIRARHGISAFESIFPADLIEQVRDAA